MTEDTTDTNNVKQFTLNLVSPEKKDDELRECLNKGIDTFVEQVKIEGVQSFFAIVLDGSDNPVLIGAGEAQTLRTLGALEMAIDALLTGV